MTDQIPPPPPHSPTPNDEADPFVQLERCHRRLEEACDALSIAGTDRNEDTVANVLSFFARQITRHEADEEESLFPRCGGPTSTVNPTLDRLRAEHREHETLHAKLERLMHAKELDEDARWSAIETVSASIARAYRAHIELEEKELFPSVRTLLSPEAKREMVNEMAARRGK